MYIAMSLVILAYVFHEFLSSKGLIKSFKLSTGVINTALFGLLAGVIGGATNAMSPILMMYLFSKTDNKHEIVKSSNICYLFGKIVQLSFLGSHMEQLVNEEWLLIFLITIISIGFLFIGIRLRTRVSNRLFKNTIYLILLILSIKIGHSGLSALNS